MRLCEYIHVGEVMKKVRKGEMSKSPHTEEADALKLVATSNLIKYTCPR